MVDGTEPFQTLFEGPLVPSLLGEYRPICDGEVEIEDDENEDVREEEPELLVAIS
jgi:hypothetical protein